MASSGGSQLTALCAVASFLWLARSIEGHQLIEQPRLSSLLLLLTASAGSFAASFLSQWLPGANGRFDDDLGLRRPGRPSLPNKPRRYFLPGLIICLVIRLEMFHRVSLDFQCSTPGVEAFLPAVIFLYERLLERDIHSREDKARDDDYDDMGETIWEYFIKTITSWLSSSSSFLLSYGAHLVTSQDTPSNFFCASFDRSYFVVFLQYAGLLLDGAIVVLSWRILTWTRTTKSRLKTLSGILSASALGTGFLYWSCRLFQASNPMSYHFRGLDSLFIFDVVVDGITLSVCLVSTSLLVVEGKPLSLVGIIAFLSGTMLAIQKIKLSGSWENVSPISTSFTLALICISFSFFVYENNLRYVAMVHRILLVFILTILVIATTIFSIVKAYEVLNNHPLQRIIYDSRVGADRWLVRATTSNSLPIAVQEYKDRHNGRDPPAKFDIWYDFATKRKSPIIDHFAQIETDILPFWDLSPKKIRQDIHRIASEPDIALIKIQSGVPLHNVPPNSPHRTTIEDLVKMINTFAKHLPDMDFAVNLDERPRVLTPWEDVKGSVAAGHYKGLRTLLKRAEDIDSQVESSLQNSQKRGAFQITPQSDYTAVRALREMTALTCPPGTATRSGGHWDIRDFCSSCANPQSQGHFLTNWPLSQEICHQSDLLRLHGFHMTSPEFRPLQELVPVFSRSKTGSYSDILIPLKRSGDQDEQDGSQDFAAKQKTAFWRGSMKRTGITPSHHDLLHGGQQERLAHLVNNNKHGSSGKTTLILPTSRNKGKFTYQQVSTSTLNTLLPFDVAFTNYTPPDQVKKPITPDPPPELSHQYILTVDTDSGPPPNFLSVLHSKSVPFHASIFQEWYTERLTPWVHFVPVDLRWHALHSTLAYFTGIHAEDKDKDKKEKEKRSPPVKGNEVKKAGGGNAKWPDMSGAELDGKWIAEEGMKWAKKVLRREDMEVYLFRLLLEWARVVSDDREGMKFVL